MFRSILRRRPIAGRQTMPVIALSLICAATARHARADEPATCLTCHAEQAEQLSGSVHKPLRCTKCHGGDESYELSADALGGFVGRSADSAVTFDHGAAFTGKPLRMEIPQLCGDCHANVSRMNPFGLRTDQLARYWTSGHGQQLKKGDQRVAVCIDCHGSHDILAGREPMSRTHATNVPDTCGQCHADKTLMGSYDLPFEIVDEYRRSVHGDLLLNQGDTGAPTCATCHGNHSAIPPGFADVGSVCGQCHQNEAAMFATSIHAKQEEHKKCVQCHGGGEDRHYHLIERITKPPGVMFQLYSKFRQANPRATDAQITASINPDPKKIITHALPTCLECHEDLEDDESLPKLFTLLNEIAEAERSYVRTAERLDEIGRGVLLVDNQRFLFDDAKTHLIELAPIQHTLDNKKVEAKIAELNSVCKQVNAELDELEAGLDLRYRALVPIWIFTLCFSAVLYAKFKQLKRAWVKPLPKNPTD
jgi:hypothetical protein